MQLGVGHGLAVPPLKRTRVTNSAQEEWWVEILLAGGATIHSATRHPS